MVETRSEEDVFHFDPLIELGELWHGHSTNIIFGYNALHQSGIYFRRNQKDNDTEARLLAHGVSFVAGCLARDNSQQGRFFNDILEKNLEDALLRAKLLLKSDFDLESLPTRDIIRDMGCLGAVVEFMHGFAAYRKIKIKGLHE